MILFDIMNKTLIDQNKKTIINFLCRPIITKDKKDDGRNRETWLFNKRLRQVFGNKTVDDLTTKDIDHFRNQLLKKGLKPATVRLPMELMRRLFNFGDKQGYCVVPRTLHFNFPTVDNQKTEYLNDEELQRYEQALELYESTKNPEEKIFFVAYAYLVMYTGIRRLAAIALRWDDCDFEKGFIRAEVIKYDDYITLGSEAACRDAGKISIEGKDYLPQDGDIMHFRFNV